MTDWLRTTYRPPAKARGSIKQRADGRWVVWVYAGRNPLTGKERRLTGTAKTEEAERVRTRLLTEVDRRRALRSKLTVAQMIEDWLDTAELEQTTRDGYQRYATARSASSSEHRLDDSPAVLATPPKFTRQEVKPQAFAEARLLLDAAGKRDPDFAALLWLAMITGMRRGELLGLRWSHVRLEAGGLLVSRNYVESRSGRREKDTKTHQARRIALDEVTVGILAEHYTCRAERATACGATLAPSAFVFSRSVDGKEPLIPHSVSQRIVHLGKRLGIEVNLQSLRHFMGTAMLTDGTDLRTVAGRLGHVMGAPRRCGSTPTSSRRLITEQPSALQRQCWETRKPAREVRRPQRVSSARSATWRGRCGLTWCGDRICGIA